MGQHSRGGLPQAVEVVMRLRSHEQPEVPDVPLEAGVSVERLTEYRHPLYRLLIVLSGRVVSPSAGNGPGNGSLLETGTHVSFSRP